MRSSRGRASILGPTLFPEVPPEPVIRLPHRALLVLRLLPCLAILGWLLPRPARAVLDIEDRGPRLEAGRFAMRVTNAGLLGNAFFDAGRCFDPSFEFPRGSGVELLNHAELWVGALDGDAVPHVSGGPMLEFRPTLDPADHVRTAWRDRLGALRMVDDDHDGRVDEEILNDRDDDGDGEIDEDLGMFAQQMAAADYVDDRPEAVNYVYDNGERHVPLGLSVHQEAYAWSVAGADGIAAVTFHITNHGAQTLRQLYVGVLADLDSRVRSDRRGHLDDRLDHITFDRQVNRGTSFVTISSGTPQDPPTISCIDDLAQTVPVVRDGVDGSGLPMGALVGLDHTIDPYAIFGPLQSYARAPGHVSFRSVAFRRDAVPGYGGLPTVDPQRYDALAGRAVGASGDGLADWVVLVSCGPFPRLAPGESIDVSMALVAGADRESLAVALGNAAVIQHGTTLNLVPDSTGAFPTDWNEGVSGINGHEVCLEPPPGVSFYADPHCPGKARGESPAPETRTLYQPGHCVWTDADCDECTGKDGRETVLRWLDPGEVPPPPRFRVTPGDHWVDVAWDNRPEVLIAGGQLGTRESRFLGYRLYRIADWGGRLSLVPPPEHWALMNAYARSTANSEVLLSTITDTTLDYERILYEQKLYPIGRYAVRDSTVLDGFPYLYTITSVYELVTRAPNGTPTRRVLESPLVASADRAVVPHASARTRAGQVWVVPNPFRAHADWDLPPVDGDRLTRHIDFMGLPRARCVIKVWTVAGDFVAQLDHDASGGDGQAAWDLVSRNGQEVESGIYLFTVDSALGHQIGRFVVVR